jgi:hypothetical protein
MAPSKASKFQKDLETYHRLDKYFSEARAKSQRLKAIKNLEDLRQSKEFTTGKAIYDEVMVDCIELGMRLAEEFNQDPKARIESLLIMEQFACEQKLEIIKGLREAIKADEQGVQ